jgi:hypothetical protein
MVMSKNDLEQWRKQLQSDVASDQQRLRDNTERLRHVNALLGVGNGTSPHDDVMVASEQILRASSKPMHVKVLAQKLMDIGIPLPGRGDIVNLVSRLHHSPKFKRVGRGTYTPV